MLHIRLYMFIYIYIYRSEMLAIHHNQFELYCFSSQFCTLHWKVIKSKQNNVYSRITADALLVLSNFIYLFYNFIEFCFCYMFILKKI